MRKELRVPILCEDQLTAEERAILLDLARKTLEERLRGDPLGPIEFEKIPPRLQTPGATFVTLTMHGALRGCIGALEAYQPLVEDVREHTLAAAFQDYRFPSVGLDELPEIEIEISRLTPPEELNYENPDDLVEQLRPFVDGVTLRDGIRRATFLPQVWEKISEPSLFLDQLCVKMGGDSHLWRVKQLQVFTYQVESFHE